jgi:hypothetical protein
VLGEADVQIHRQVHELGVQINRKKANSLKDIYEVLREKELQKARVEREVECLKIVVPLLSEESEREAVPEDTKPEAKAPVKRRTWP